MYEALRTSSRYHLDYLEVDSARAIPHSGFDFYAFNYHHVRMSWLEASVLSALPGFKAAFVLEVAPGDPFVLCPQQGFDAHCALDPTLKHWDRRVYGFPRPLEPGAKHAARSSTDIPVIGSFGFATPGKGFELVAAAVNREFDRAILRINVPPGDFADPLMRDLQRRDYAQYLGDLVRAVAKPSIEVRFTRDYFSKEQLIGWCAENTLNCFLYNRAQPGLSATTDQAITCGRPLAVSANPTFRHLHEYLTPYPYRTLRQSIAESEQEVARMQTAWAPAEFGKRFEEVLEDAKLLAKGARTPSQRRTAAPKRTPVLLVNHSAKQCGINQYGKNVAAALGGSRRYEVTLAECSNEEDLVRAIARVQPHAIIYNYYETTMPWLNAGITRGIPLPQLGVMHEVTQERADHAKRDMFDFHLCPDPTLIARNPAALRTPRLIPTYLNYQRLPEIPTIGSFGFGIGDKGFTRIVDQVQTEFDEALIRIQMPFNDVVDPGGRVHALQTAEACRKRLRKSGVRLEISHDFLSKAQLLDFLASNTLNAFFYEEGKFAGISSTIEHALAVQRPIAITRCGMFRHVLKAAPSVCIDEASLKDIITAGIAPLVPFYDAWSEDRFISEYDQLLDRALEECWAAGGRLVEGQAPAIHTTGKEGASMEQERNSKAIVDPAEIKARLREWLAALGYTTPRTYELAGSLPTKESLAHQLEANLAKLRAFNQPRTEVPATLRRSLIFRLPIVGRLAGRFLLSFLWLLFADQRRFNQAVVDAVAAQSEICLSLAETIDRLTNRLMQVEDAVGQSTDAE